MAHGGAKNNNIGSRKYRLEKREETSSNNADRGERREDATTPPTPIKYAA